jgi:hypothetical protein
MSEIDRRARRNVPGYKTSGSSCRTDASTSEGKRRATIANVLTVLRRLEGARIRYRLEQTRDDAIAVEVVVPGERWEIEFLETGEIEIEIFKSNGQIFDAQALDDLCARFSD